MSTDLARELDHRYRTRFANDEAAKTLNPPKIAGAGVDVEPLAMPPAKDAQYQNDPALVREYNELVVFAKQMNGQRRPSIVAGRYPDSEIRTMIAKLQREIDGE